MSAFVNDILGNDILGTDTLGADTLGADTLGADTLGADTSIRIQTMRWPAATTAITVTLARVSECGVA